MSRKYQLITAVIILIITIIPSGLLIADNVRNDDQKTDLITYVPRTMTYQGILKDSGGEPIPDSLFDAVFRIFDDESIGNQEWSQTITDIETDEQGRFTVTFTNVDLGFDEDYWLEIEVNGTLLTPRQKLNMSPFAGASIVSDYAGDSDLLDGYNSSEFAEATHSHSEAAGWVDDGPVVRLENSGDDVGIGIMAPQAPLHVVSGSAGPWGTIHGHNTSADNRGYLGGSAYGVYGSGNIAGIYGIHPTSGNFGFLGSSAYGVYGRSDAGSAGYFYGDVEITENLAVNVSAQIGDLIDANRIQLNQFRLSSGATAGYILTSDASGNGTWQASNAITGPGVAGSIPKYSGANTITSSVIVESGNNIGIGTIPSSAKLDVNGNVRVRSGLTVDNSVSVADLVDANRVYVSQFRKSGGASSGYVLTSDASGNGTWQALPSFINSETLSKLETKVNELINTVKSQNEKIEQLENQLRNLESNR